MAMKPIISNCAIRMTFLCVRHRKKEYLMDEIGVDKEFSLHRLHNIDNRPKRSFSKLPPRISTGCNIVFRSTRKKKISKIEKVKTRNQSSLLYSKRETLLLCFHKMLLYLRDVPVQTFNFESVHANGNEIT